MTLCSKPGCGGSGTAILAYNYAAREAMLEDPDEGQPSPHVYVLCEPCAEKIRPPQGWTLHDRRARPPLFLDRLEARRAARAVEQAAADQHRPSDSARQLFFGHS
jgi:hypothetical protein